MQAGGLLRPNTKIINKYKTIPIIAECNTIIKPPSILLIQLYIILIFFLRDLFNYILDKKKRTYSNKNIKCKCSNINNNNKTNKKILYEITDFLIELTNNMDERRKIITNLYNTIRQYSILLAKKIRFEFIFVDSKKVSIDF